MRSVDILSFYARMALTTFLLEPFVNPLSVPHIIETARVAKGLSVSAAAELVSSSKRSWEAWEAGTRPMPGAKLLLFMRMIAEDEQLVMIYRFENGVPRPVDSLVESSFIGLEQLSNGDWLSKSVAVDPFTGRGYVHVAKFVEADNKKALETLKGWKGVVERAVENFMLVAEGE
jgi:hypothetical protein